MLPVAILAGGLATRLRPITERVPKALLQIAGRPFIEWQLTNLRAQGVSIVVLCTGFLSGEIEALVGNGDNYGLKISYSRDGPSLLGTGGALQNALPLLGDAFFVMYGDSFLPINFTPIQTAFESAGKAGFMTVLRNVNKWDLSNVEFEDGALIEYNKLTPRADMTYIDYGLGILSAKTLTEHSFGKSFDLADLYHELSISQQLVGYEVYNRFYEIGSLAGIIEAEAYLSKKN